MTTDDETNPSPPPPSRRPRLVARNLVLLALGYTLGLGSSWLLDTTTPVEGKWLCCSVTGVCWNIPIGECDGDDEILQWCDDWREIDPLTHEAECYD